MTNQRPDGDNQNRGHENPRSCLTGLQQKQMRAHPQTLRYPFDVVYRDVALAPLDPAEIRPVHLDIVSKLLLANAQLFAETAYVRSNDRPQASGMGAFHSS